MPANTIYQVRRGTASQWASQNPVLLSGEWGLETDTRRMKQGDGTTAWNSLTYAFIFPTDFVAGSGVTLTFGANNSTLTITSSGGGGGSSIDAEYIQDIIGLSGITGVSGIQTTYNDTTGLTTISLNNPSINVTGIVGLQEAVEDIVGTGNFINTGFLRNASGIGWVYNDSSGTLTASVTGIPLTSVLGVTSSTTELNYLDGSVPGSVSASNAVVVDANKDISSFRNLSATGTLTATLANVTSNLTVGGTISTTGNVTVGGDLTVKGTTTTVNSTTVEIGDNIIRVNTSGLSTGGFEVRDGIGANYQSLVWDNSNNRWDFTGPTVRSTGTIVSNTLQSTVSSPTAPFVVASTGLVTNLNADLLDGQHGSYYLDWTNVTNKPDPIVTVNITGDVSGNGSATLTDLGNGTININTIIQPDSVTLGTDTVGNYVATVSVDGTGLSRTGTGEGAGVVVTSNATPANITGTIVARDSTGSFIAGTITANSFVGYGGSITGIYANNISSGTLNVARLPTNIPVTNLTSSGITLGTTVVNLGQTSTVIDGLTRISGASLVSPVYIQNAVIDGGSP
jgi:hypothetical protein